MLIGQKVLEPWLLSLISRTEAVIKYCGKEVPLRLDRIQNTYNDRVPVIEFQVFITKYLTFIGNG